MRLPGRRRVVRAALLVAALVATRPAAAAGQVFLASHARPTYTIGPLYIRAAVTPDLGVLPIDVYWSLVLPPGRPPAEVVGGDLFLLWPSAVSPAPNLGPPDPELTRHVEARGFVSIEEGRVDLSTRDANAGTEAKREPVPGGAPFVSFVRQGGALGLSAPATYIRVPWNPKLADPTRMTRLHLQTKGLIKPKSSTWAERAFWGRRFRLLLSFQDVNARAIFPLYFERRDRVVHLAEDPAQLRIEFANADHLKIDEIAPPSSRRGFSETRDNTEVVTLFLDQSEGIRPQTLTVQFGYFSGVQSWAVILIPLLFFTLGNLAAPVLKEIGARLARTVRARVHVGAPDRPQQGAAAGHTIDAATLARIKPGETTAEEVLRLCGPVDEEQEHLATPGRRLLLYRGRRVLPRRTRTWGWISTVAYWEMEHQEVEVTVDHGVVSDVQARVRRSRVSRPDA